MRSDVGVCGILCLAALAAASHVEDVTEVQELTEASLLGGASPGGADVARAKMDAAKARQNAARSALDAATSAAKRADTAQFLSQSRLADAKMAVSDNEARMSITKAEKGAEERDAALYQDDAKKNSEAKQPWETAIPSAERANREAAEASVQIAKQNLAFMMEDPEVRRRRTRPHPPPLNRALRSPPPASLADSTPEACCC